MVIIFDTHYDLLSIAYTAYLKNDYSYLEKISKSFNECNVKGVIANLYFMSREEMRDELHPDYYQDDVSVLNMFIKSREILDAFLGETEILYSIEGADFIDGPDELEALYDAGLDSLILCWNTESKYASGNRSDKGLTEAGKELLNKAISLGMGIDLSHANINTFNDMVDLIEEKKSLGADVCAYASHSNSRVLHDRDRNLTDEQLKRMRDINGLVGVFSNKNFISTKDEKNYNEAYISHIDKIGNIVGFDSVMVATDDMDFCSWYDKEYGELAIYDYNKIAQELSRDLIDKYGDAVALSIIYGNAKEKIFNKIKNKRLYKKGAK